MLFAETLLVALSALRANKLRSFEGVAPQTTDWRVVGLTDEELTLRGLKPPQTNAAE